MVNSEACWAVFHTCTAPLTDNYYLVAKTMGY